MDRSRREVLIHIIGAAGSGRCTFIRRYILDRYDPYYCLISGAIDPYSCTKTFAGEAVPIKLDHTASTVYQAAAEEPAYYKMAQVPDAMIIFINPARPSALEETIRLRLEQVRNVVSAGDEVFERVVIVKDVGMSWVGRLEGDAAEVPLNLTPEEREVEEQEWRDGADKGYELARKLGAEVGVTVACSRTGEGVKEAVDDLVAKVLGKRKAAEERRAQEEQRRRDEAARAAQERRVQEERRQRDEAARAAAPRWERLLWDIRQGFRNGRRQSWEGARRSFARVFKYILDEYDPCYNPICHEDAFACTRTFVGVPVPLELDNEAPIMYRHVGDEIRQGKSVVLDPNERAEVPLNLTPEEREIKEQEWRDGAEKGYKLARRLGVEAIIACSRTGKGVKEVVDDLFTKVLEKRRVDEAKKAEEARRRQEVRLLAGMPRWKRLLWRATSWKDRERS